MSFMQKLMIIVIGSLLCVTGTSQHDYSDALTKSILFFEGQRSGKLPPTQRMTWRKDSGLQDGFQVENSLFPLAQEKVDLVGGYYDAGDNVKFNFPMAFTTTMLAWSVLEFGKFMGPDLNHTIDAIIWATDYFIKATNIPGYVFVQVGNPNEDHNCWERPEDMDEPRLGYAVSKNFPGSEVSAEIAAALAASSIVFRKYHIGQPKMLLHRARTVFEFADKYRGSYSDTLGNRVCPFYCDFGGYEDELLWGAAWMLKATRDRCYMNYIKQNIQNVKNIGEFGWDTKDAGINVLLTRIRGMNSSSSMPYMENVNKFVCSMVPESPSLSVQYSKGGLLFKAGGSNMQHATAASFLLLVHASHLHYTKQNVDCGNNFFVSPQRLRELAKSQVDYILGSNPLNMSYMVGYGQKFPLRIHHRASSLPSIVDHPSHIQCKEGTVYYESQNPNSNLLVGAVVGGPDINDAYIDSRPDVAHSEPTTYINAPLVGVLAFFTAHSHT